MFTLDDRCLFWGAGLGLGFVGVVLCWDLSFSV